MPSGVVGVIAADVSANGRLRKTGERGKERKKESIQRRACFNSCDLEELRSLDDDDLSREYVREMQYRTLGVVIVRKW